MAFRLYSLLVYTLTFPSGPNKTPRVVNDAISNERIRSTAFTPQFLSNPLHSIILSTNCVTHMSMFPLSPDGWMNEKVYASPDIPISSSSPIVRLWFSSSPTVLNVDDDPRKRMFRALSWCIAILNRFETELMMSGCVQFAKMYLILSCRFS